MRYDNIITQTTAMAAAVATATAAEAAAAGAKAATAAAADALAATTTGAVGDEWSFTIFRMKLKFRNLRDMCRAEGSCCCCCCAELRRVERGNATINGKQKKKTKSFQSWKNKKEK